MLNNSDIKNKFDNRLASINFAKKHVIENQKNKYVLKRTKTFYGNLLINNENKLEHKSNIYQDLCHNYISVLENKSIKETVSYKHKDGTIHKGIILDNQTILVKDDPKLNDTIFMNVIKWITALEDFLPVTFFAKLVIPE